MDKSSNENRRYTSLENYYDNKVISIITEFKSS